jgi:hypothetical protein
LFYYANGVAQTVQSELPKGSYWQIEYANSNPEDTDNGYHPQNIFRLETLSRWQNLDQQVSFKIVKDNLSSSENRNCSNGVLLFNRYVDQNNLYYTGIRVDGAAVIKKKIAGTYYTLGYKQIFPGDYDAVMSPDLLPKNTWMKIRSVVKNDSTGRVIIQLYLSRDAGDNWQLVLESIDDGRSFGGAAITGKGSAGIRTDFMDVQFDNYQVRELN